MKNFINKDINELTAEQMEVLDYEEENRCMRFEFYALIEAMS